MRTHRNSQIGVVALLLLLAAPAAHSQRGGFPSIAGIGRPEAIPAGTRVQYKTYSSSLMKTELRYAIYLPASYATSGNRSYPVLYFLHGLSENEMRWSTRSQADVLLDDMVADKQIGEFIVAIPASSTNGFFANARDGSAPWEDALVQEFIPLIESSYRVSKARSTRGISGISMGGYGALKTAMKYPEMFGSVSAYSAALVPDFDSASDIVKAFLSLGDVIFGIGFNKPMRDYSYWDANNPLELAKNTARLQGMKIFFECGTEDSFGFFEGHKVLDQRLTAAKYPHTAGLFPGPHGWVFAKAHMRESLLFHWDAFNGK